MKKALIVFLTSALVAPVLAQSAQPWSAISDGRRNYTLSNKTDCPKLEAPGASQSDLTNVAGDPKSALNAVPALTAQLQEQIVELEKQLATMPATPENVPMVLATFNGKPVTNDFYNQFVSPIRAATKKQIEVFKKVPLIAELRDHWIEGTLYDISHTADNGVGNNSLISMADQAKFEALRQEFGKAAKPQDETACAQASQNLEMQDAIVRSAYQTSYRAAFAAVARISDKTYRYWGQLQLAYIVWTFNGELIKLQDDALYKLDACSVQPKIEPILAGEMPPAPKACVPQTASTAPKVGFALTVSCDLITLNFNPPAWIPRFQILKKGVTPFEKSRYDLRLTAFSSGGFGLVNREGVLIDAGGTGPAAGKDFRHVFDSSKPAPVWFLSVERGAGH
jgi:hypothetical protein